MGVDYKAVVSTIVKKTYDYHGIANGSWGRGEDDELCSYSAGCAIGLSLSPRTAERLDLDGEALGGGLGVNSALEYPEVREDLFGSAEKPPEWVGQALRKVQTTHDAAAIKDQAVSEREVRAYYRRGIEFVAKKYELEQAWESPMTDAGRLEQGYIGEEELDLRGYYIFSVNQDEFVQVCDKETDKVLLIGLGRRDALRKATLILREAQP